MSLIAPMAPQKPPPSVRPELIADEVQRFEAADDKRHDNRHGGYGHVVVELADRLHERPAIGAQHQHAVRRVDQGHSGSEQGRKHHDRRERSTVGRLHRRNAEQRDFGRGVEPQAEQEPDREHVPAFGYEAEQRTEKARQEPAIVEQYVEILLDERFASFTAWKVR